MNIALVADDKRKELMVQFCIAYCGILAKHNVFATATTGKMVSNETGIRVNCLMSGIRGGSQQLVNKIAYDEIDLLIFFRDPTSARLPSENTNDLMRLCDMHNIPVATNIATGEILIRALDRGDLDWRKSVNRVDI